MQLVARPLDIDAGGKLIVLINKDTADELGIKPLERVILTFGKKSMIGLADVTDRVVDKEHLGTYEAVTDTLGIRGGERIEIARARQPDSVQYIKEKIGNKALSYEKILSIVKDTANKTLARAEIAAFLTAITINPPSMEEIEYLTRSMTEIGGSLNLRKKMVFDKHSVGGTCGDKTTMLVVPIVAAAGFTIPKTSSRAITSPAGTADRVEVLMPVTLSIEEIRKVVGKTNGCMVWGGALELSPADDMFIQVEYPLGIDPLLLPSVMSKKRAVGATHVVIDIPMGPATKIKTEGEASDLAASFIELGKRIGITVRCAMTSGIQPIGRGIGPVLEAREALMTLEGDDAPQDLIDKATSVAGLLMEMGGVNNGKDLALKMISSGKAAKKMREIMEAQGGNHKIRSRDLVPGDYSVDIKSNENGYVTKLKNSDIAAIARTAGAPRDKGAGVYLHKKLDEPVKRNDELFTIYAEKQSKLEHALELLNKLDPVRVSKQGKMLLKTFPGGKVEKYFFLER